MAMLMRADRALGARNRNFIFAPAVLLPRACFYPANPSIAPSESRIASASSTAISQNVLGLIKVAFAIGLRACRISHSPRVFHVGGAEDWGRLSRRRSVEEEQGISRRCRSRSGRLHA